MFELGGRELLHQGELGLPDCLPATVSPLASSSTYSALLCTPSSHEACIVLLQKALIKCQGFSAHWNSHTTKSEGGSNTSGAISHHLWPSRGYCTYSWTQTLSTQVFEAAKYSGTWGVQVLRYSGTWVLRYSCTRGVQVQLRPVQCSVSSFPPPLARRKP